MRAGIHRLENIGRTSRCTGRLHAALTRLALQNYPLTLGHNRTHQCHLGVSGSEVRGLGEVRRRSADEACAGRCIRAGWCCLCDRCGIQRRIGLCRFNWNSCDWGSAPKTGLQAWSKFSWR